MHILLIHQIFTTLDEAGGTRHVELAEYLISKGHEVTVVASDISFLSGKKIHRRRTRLDSGIEVRRARTFGKIHSGFAGRLLGFMTFMASSFFSALTVKDVDLIFVTSPPIFQAITAYIVSRIRRKPYVLEVRDLWPDFMVEIGAIRNPFLIFASRLIEKFLYKNSRTIIVNTPGFISFISAKIGSDKRINLVPNGVDTSMFKPPEEGKVIRKNLGLEDRFIVLYAGAIGISNDIETLLNAAGILREEPDVFFLIVGGGNEKERMIAMAKELSLDNVMFLDPIAKKHMPEMIAAADAAVAILKNIPMFRTTYPNKVFDYMAGERPVILAIDGVIRELVEKAGAGIFVPPGDALALAEAIRILRNDEGMRKEMGRRGRALVEKCFERRKQAEEFERVLTDSLRGG